MTDLQTKNIFHEIKNQISVCELYTEVIKRTLEKEGIENTTLTRAIKNIKNSLELITQSATSLRETKLDNYNLYEIIENVFEICRTYNNINLKNKITPEQNILADKNKLTSALVNIVKNAIEANATEVKISYKNDTIIIENNGDSIPAELQEKIFTDGFTTKETGSGLGLILTKSMLQEQGLKLCLTQSTQETTTFIISKI